MTAPSPRLPLFLGLAVAVICLGFAAFTGHIWEDYFITFRSSLNLATGHGLVFQEGEKVHTFTSPLGTLLPALFAIGGGDNVAVRALWLFRLVNAAALGGAIWLAGRTMLRDGLVPAAVGFVCFAWTLDPKTIDFSINGMESALLVFFIILTWQAFANGARLLPCALGFAGLQWTRPDGCVFFAAVAAGWFFFGVRPASLDSWKMRCWTAIRAGALGMLLFLPWVIFAWRYYGTPVPHTIVAKISPHGPGAFGPALALYPWRLLFGEVSLHGLFMPAYYFLGGWPVALTWLSRLLAVVAAFAWLWRRVRPAGRAASLAFFLGGFYVESIPRSPWYYPGWQALAFVTLAYLVDAGLRSSPGAGRIEPMRQSIVRVVAAVFVVVQGLVLGSVAWQMRTQQTLIENGQRREIGLWLRDQAAPHDRVFLEPLGYIGFYSGLKMLDYPGLSSPEVVATRRAGNRTDAQIIAALRPEWLVLRPVQVLMINGQLPFLLRQNYRLARTFDASAAVDATAMLPGRGYVEYDSLFFVFHREETAVTAP